MSVISGIRKALIELKHDPDICDKCKKVIQRKLDKLEQREADWIHSTFFSEKRVPA